MAAFDWTKLKDGVQNWRVISGLIVIVAMGLGGAVAWVQTTSVAVAAQGTALERLDSRVNSVERAQFSQGATLLAVQKATDETNKNVRALLARKP